MLKGKWNEGKECLLFLALKMWEFSSLCRINPRNVGNLSSMLSRTLVGFMNNVDNCTPKEKLLPFRNNDGIELFVCWNEGYLVIF